MPHTAFLKGCSAHLESSVYLSKAIAQPEYTAFILEYNPWVPSLTLVSKSTSVQGTPQGTGTGDSL